MPDTNEAASPASPAVGDGSKKSSSTENVSESQAVSHFMRMEEKRAKEATANTDAEVAKAPEESGENNADGEAKQAPLTEAEAKPESETSEATEKEATETEAKEEGKEEADEVLSPESQNLDAKTKQKIQKRIDREVGKRKALEDQVKQLNEKLSSLSQQQPVPEAAQKATPVVVGTPPLPDIKDVAALKEYQKSAKETVRWAEEVLDRDDIDQGVTIGNKEYTKAEIKAVLRNAKLALEDTIPAQQEWFQQNNQFQQQKQTFTKQAQEKFPFLADRNSAEFKWAQQFYQSAPWLHNLAASDFFIGAYIKGMQALQAEEKAAELAKTKSKEPEKPKVVIPKTKAPSDQAEVSSTGTPQRLTPDATSNRALGVEYEKLRAKRGVTSEDAAKFLERRDTLRQR